VAVGAGHPLMVRVVDRANLDVPVSVALGALKRILAGYQGHATRLLVVDDGSSLRLLVKTVIRFHTKAGPVVVAAPSLNR
jgi:hypothetical protein